MNTTQHLATFDDRLTMRHAREYPHPIERVWEAVTTTEHLDVWLLPASQIERRQGGKCSFSWGSPVGESMEGTVSVFDPPTRVRYELPDGFIQLNLEVVDAGCTRLTFLQGFFPGAGLEPSEWLGGDQPAGPDTPWKPGFVAGFHSMLNQLGSYLDGEWTREQVQPAIDAVYAGRGIGEAWEEHPETRGGDDAENRTLIDVYRAHIKGTIPDA